MMTFSTVHIPQGWKMIWKEVLILASLFSYVHINTPYDRTANHRGEVEKNIDRKWFELHIKW